MFNKILIPIWEIDGNFFIYTRQSHFSICFFLGTSLTSLSSQLCVYGKIHEHIYDDRRPDNNLQQTIQGNLYSFCFHPYEILRNINIKTRDISFVWSQSLSHATSLRNSCAINCMVLKNVNQKTKQNKKKKIY